MKSGCEASILNSWETGGACLAAVTVLEGCNTSLHPGNQIGVASTLMICSSHGVWGVLSSSRGPPNRSCFFCGSFFNGVVSGSQLSTLKNAFLRLVPQEPSGGATLSKIASSKKEM